MTDSAQTIHITPSSPEGCGGVVRYTTNGTTPTSSSPVFPSGGVFVNWNQTVTIKARTFAGGWTASPVRTITVHVSSA